MFDTIQDNVTFGYSIFYVSEHGLPRCSECDLHRRKLVELASDNKLAVLPGGHRKEELQALTKH